MIVAQEWTPGHRFSSIGGRPVVPCGCQRCQLDRSFNGCWGCGKVDQAAEKGAEFVTIRIRAGAGIGGQ